VLEQRIAVLSQRLADFGLGKRLALASWTSEPLPSWATSACVAPDLARDADLLWNMCYDGCQQALPLFRRKAFLDIDPGLLQVWMSEGVVKLPPHDLYFTTGETVGRPEALFPGGGVPWRYTPPCVALSHWPVSPAPADAPFTTVSHWTDAQEWVTFGGQTFPNDKRSGFLPLLDIPAQSPVPLELALCLNADAQLRLEPDELEEHQMLTAKGWRIRHAHAVAGSPQDYQRYVQASRGEFSGAKPSCVRFQNAWVSDRTLCYLASGRPAVVQHTGPSRYIPDDTGLLRFHDATEAVRCLERAVSDYDRHSRRARQLAEEFFDVGKVIRRVLEQALP
jgi:hypothetical protein